METTEYYIKELERYIIKTANSFGIDDDFIKEELIQIANIAIFRGLQTYDEEKGAAIKTHLMLAIKGAMQNYLTNNLRTIRLPQNQIINKIQFKQPISTSIVIDEETKMTIAETIIDNIEESNDYSQLYKCISKLEPIEQKVISMYFGFNCQSMSLREIGKNLGYSQEWVRKILIKAQDKLKDTIDIKQL